MNTQKLMADVLLYLHLGDFRGYTLLSPHHSARQLTKRQAWLDHGPTTLEAGLALGLRSLDHCIIACVDPWTLGHTAFATFCSLKVVLGSAWQMLRLPVHIMWTVYY